MRRLCMRWRRRSCLERSILGVIVPDPEQVEVPMKGRSIRRLSSEYFLVTDHDDCSVWLNDHPDPGKGNGICIGAGNSVPTALADAVQMLEEVEQIIRGGDAVDS